MKTTKRLLSLLLSLIIALTGLVGLAFTAGAKGYKVGDIIELGSYPQTEVKDEALITALNAVPGIWQSYDYYVGTGDWDGQMAPSDIMSYHDVQYNGQLYRGVQISHYRPRNTYLSTNTTAGFRQMENGYMFGRVYWFKFEPLKWRVLDPGTGIVMSELIIDSQPFQNYALRQGKDPLGADAEWGSSAKQFYTNNYENSSIRSWLNLDFYATAFTADARSNVIKTTMDMDNTAYDPSASAFNGAQTDDKVFLLSLKDIQNTAYGFKADPTEDDLARHAYVTDYSKCQGVATGSENKASWLLRTAGRYSFFVCETGGRYYPYAETTATSFGIRPGMTLDLQAYDAYLLKNSQLNVPQAATVDYKSTVTVTAKAAVLPKGCIVALYDGDTQLVKGDSETVSYTMTKMKESKTLTAKVIDANGNVQSNAGGLLEKEITITVKAGFFAKVKAFFRGLFGLLPKITLEP